MRISGRWLAALCAATLGCIAPLPPDSVAQRIDLPARPGMSERPAPTEAAPSLTARQAHDRLDEVFANAGVEPSTYLSDQDVANLVAAGASEELTRLALEDALRTCPEDLDGAAMDAGALDCRAAMYLSGLLARIADPAPGTPSPSIRLLARFGGRERSHGSRWLETVLERRFLATSLTCSPPTEDLVTARESSLPDFVASPVNGSRRLGRAEKRDLAYALVAVERSGPPVGSAVEDTTTPPLAPDAPERVAHAKRQDQMRQALRVGAIERYVEVGVADLEAFGYPGPIRVRADGDMRWGGAGMSYQMRELALHAELIGKRELAHDLYRRANPGGGTCGTSFGYIRDGQIAGVIRTATDCLTVAAELLFAAADDDAYGPLTLSRAGFDVGRIYRGLLPTLHGSAPWATRTRAIEGLADVEKGSAIETLVALGRTENAENQGSVLYALGKLAETHGADPCASLGFGFGSSSSSRPRQVRSANLECTTRIPAARMTALARAVEWFLRSNDPSVRGAAATALGQIAESRSRAALRPVASNDPETWVRDDATEALAAITEAERTRAEERRSALNPD
jgi:hypothetical protein